MHPPQIVTEDGWVHVDDLDPTVTLYHRISTEEAQYITNALPDTRVFTVFDVKGGVRKSTATVHIGHGIHRHTGKRVGLGDSDQYHSVQDWYNTAHRINRDTGQRVSPWPKEISVFSASGPNFHHQLVDELQKDPPDYFGLDTPPNDRAAALRALLLADVAIIPTGPFPLDIRRLRTGLQVATEAVKLRGRPMDVRALVTGAKMGTNIFSQAREFLREQNLPSFAMPVRDLVLHATNFGTALRNLGDYEFVPDELLPLLDARKGAPA